MGTGTFDVPTVPALVPLAYVYQQDQKLAVYQEGVSCLASLTSLSHSKVGVVTIVGPSKSGKRHLLSRWGGISINTAPAKADPGCCLYVLRNLIKGQQQDTLVLLLDLDVEDNVVGSAKEQLLGLALLLTSVVVVNLRGQLHAPLASALASAAACVYLRADGQLCHASPRFICVLRDQPVHGDMETAHELMETQLKRLPEDKLLEGSKHNWAARKNAHRVTRRVFPDRQALAMSKPLSSMKHLAVPVEGQEESQLLPSFVAALNLLRYKLQDVPAKEACGQAVTLNHLPQLVQAVVAMCNESERLPDMQAAWDRMVDGTCQEAADIGFEEYEDSMQQAAYMGSNSLDAVRNLHRESWDAARKSYLDRTSHINEAKAVDKLRDLRERCELVQHQMLHRASQQPPDGDARRGAAAKRQATSRAASRAGTRPSTALGGAATAVIAAQSLFSVGAAAGPGSGSSTVPLTLPPLGKGPGSGSSSYGSSSGPAGLLSPGRKQGSAAMPQLPLLDRAQVGQVNVLARESLSGFAVVGPRSSELGPAMSRRRSSVATAHQAVGSIPGLVLYEEEEEGLAASPGTSSFLLGPPSSSTLSSSSAAAAVDAFTAAAAGSPLVLRSGSYNVGAYYASGGSVPRYAITATATNTSGPIRLLHIAASGSTSGPGPRSEPDVGSAARRDLDYFSSPLQRPRAYTASTSSISASAAEMAVTISPRSTTPARTSLPSLGPPSGGPGGGEAGAKAAGTEGAGGAVQVSGRIRSLLRTWETQPQGHHHHAGHPRLLHTHSTNL